MIFSSPLDALCLGRLIYPSREELPNLIALQFDFMKRVPARHCIEASLSDTGPYQLSDSGVFEALAATPLLTGLKSVSPDGERRIFLETSSGNMATGLAEVCAALKLNLHLLLPSYVEEATKSALRLLGAAVEEIDSVSQDARVARLESIEDEYARAGWSVERVDQYSNVNNPLSYWRVAEQVVSELDSLDVLVAAVGTGGSSTGLANYLRLSGFSDLQLVGVDACGSMNFGHVPSDFLLGGLGSDRYMPLVTHEKFDVVHWFDDATAFAAAYDLFQRNLKVGGSSGAAYLAAAHEARSSPDKSVLVVLPDNAQRYAETFLLQAWREANGIDFAKAKSVPVTVTQVADSDPSTPGVTPGWYRMDWNRRADPESRPPQGPREE